MSTKPRNISMGFTRDLFPEGTHMCLIYDNEAQRKRIIAKFLAEGIASGERTGYFADTTTRKEMNEWLSEAGVTIPPNPGKQAFDFSIASEIYYPSGTFVPAEMLSRLEEFFERAKSEGFSGARGSGEMSWALRGIPGSEHLMEYEALINTISHHHPLTPICQYNAHLFHGATLLNVLKVHPLMIVQEHIVRNPYYVQPDEFLAEYHHH